MGFCGLNILRLSSFCATGQQDDQRCAIQTEVDAVTRPDVDPEFQDAFTNAFHVRNRPALDPRQRDRHLRRRNWVKTVEPSPERAVAPFGDMFLEHHGLW